MRQSFVSTSAASTWQDGVVAGTGSFGAVLFGHPSAHTIVFSHEEFFLPLQPTPARAALIAPRLPEIRRLTADGNIADAAALIEQTARATGIHADILPLDPFVPLASLLIESSSNLEPVTYQRTGDFRTGSVEARWAGALDADCRQTETAIAMVPAGEGSKIQIRISSTHTQTLRIGMQLSSDRTTRVGSIDVTDFREFVDARLVATDTHFAAEVWPLRRPNTGSRPTSAHLMVHNLSGRMRVIGPREVDVQVGPEGDVVLEVSAFVERNAPLPKLPPSIARALPDHGEIFSACDLDLFSGIDDSTPTEVLFDRARAGEEAYETAAIELAFAAGRNAIIASTGVLPPNLVGVWQGSWAPAWSGDYTLNGNVQLGAMAGMYSTGMADLIPSLFRLLLRFPDQFEENARRLFGVGGYALPTHMSGHAHANHHSTEYPHLFWYGCGAWALRMGFDYYSVTGDVAFVREVGWPFAKKTMQFLLEATTYENGQRHFIPSYSPENTPGNASNPLSMDATMDVALARDATRIASSFAQVVGEHPPREWRDFIAALPAYRVDSDTHGLAEWAHPDVPDRVAHRHASQLYPYWYDDGDEGTSPSVDSAASQTIADKIAWRAEEPYGPPGRQEMAFGLSSVGIAAARLGDAESAYQCAIWLARDHFEPNAISRHDQGAIFNIDGCGALPALVAEMLMSTGSGKAALLRGVPARWRRGTVRGLTGRGGIVLDELTWSPEGASVTFRRRAGSHSAWGSKELRVELYHPLDRGKSSVRTIELDLEPQTLNWFAN